MKYYYVKTRGYKSGKPDNHTWAVYASDYDHAALAAQHEAEADAGKDVRVVSVTESAISEYHVHLHGLIDHNFFVAKIKGAEKDFEALIDADTLPNAYQTLKVAGTNMDDVIGLNAKPITGYINAYETDDAVR